MTEPDPIRGNNDTGKEVVERRSYNAVPHRIPQQQQQGGGTDQQGGSSGSSTQDADKK